MKNKKLFKNRWLIWALAANAFAAIALLGLANYVSVELEQYASEERWLVVKHDVGKGGNKKFWPVYRNEEYGFELKFPNSWIAKDTTEKSPDADFEISIYAPDSNLAVVISKTKRGMEEVFVFKTFLSKNNSYHKETLENIRSTFKFLE